MTRINLIHPSNLSDRHITAEWREAPRCINRAEHRMYKLGHPGVIPPEYTLGIGHESFFYDKLLFIGDRLVEIYHDMTYRGMSPDGSLLEIHIERIRSMPEVFQKSFYPTTDELIWSVSRLCRRDPAFYSEYLPLVLESGLESALKEIHYL